MPRGEEGIPIGNGRMGSLVWVTSTVPILALPKVTGDKTAGATESAEATADLAGKTFMPCCQSYRGPLSRDPIRPKASRWSCLRRASGRTIGRLKSGEAGATALTAAAAGIGVATKA